jgi:hypothetical protein
MSKKISKTIQIIFPKNTFTCKDRKENEMALKPEHWALLILSVAAFILLPVIAAYAGDVYYQYDDLNRLEQVTYEDGTLLQYIYDEVGNRTQKIVLGDTDSDGDGMPDNWEIQYGLDPDDPADADYDNDGDGLTNLAEYQLGTDPTEPDTDNDGIDDGADLCPLVLPVKIVGTSLYYSTLQAAYDAAVNNDIILGQYVNLTGDININRSIPVTIRAGYNCDFIPDSSETIIEGNMTVNDGTLTIDRGILKIE